MVAALRYVRAVLPCNSSATRAWERATSCQGGKFQAAQSCVAAVSAVGRLGLLSGQTVKRLADEIGMAVVARVLLDHVD